MTKIDSGIWNNLKQIKAKYPILFERIENMLNVAMPDIIYTAHYSLNKISCSGEMGFIENKTARENKHGKIKITYQPGQQHFLEKQRKFGAKAFMLCYLESTNSYYLFNDYFVDEYRDIEELKSLSVWHGKHFDKDFTDILAGNYE